MPASPRSSSPALVALLIAVIMVAANLFEPLSVDDCCHSWYARQVSEHPTAPFEFDIIWHQRQCSAWACMVAPGNSYYWAPGIALADNVPEEWEPVVWHLWYLPVYWLFSFSLLSILRRWVRRGAGWITAAISLGPFVLPGLNLLLEVPMLSLGLAGMAMLLRACERRSLPTAIVAGLLWGVAFQVKYSAMAFFAPWFLIAFFYWRWREWAAGLVTTVATALCIEWLISLSHGGGSYFGQQLSYAQHRDWSGLVKGMFLQVGVLGIPGVLLALHGLRLPRWTTPAAIAVYVVGLAMVGLFPDTEGRSITDGALDSLAYLMMASLTWAVLALLWLRLFVSGLRGLRNWRLTPPRALRLLLIGWILCEIISSFVVSPFPAARRVLMVALSFTAVAAWLAVRRPGWNAAVRRAVIAALLLGGSIQTVDYLEGNSWVSAADGTVAYLREHQGDNAAYFTGGWGFEYYAPRAGLEPFVCQQTPLAKGDLLACGSIDGIEGAWFWELPPAGLDERLELVETLEFGNDGVPFSNHFGYYSGQRPIDAQVGPRFVVRILRAKQDLAADALEPWDDPHFNREGN